MNSLMTITIQVRNAQAAKAIKETSSQLGQVGKAAQNAEKAMRGTQMANKFNAIAKAGNQLQWTGRQIEYRFTLPLIAAGIAAGKFAIDNERAFTRLEKVYGGFVAQGQNVNKELKQLKRGYEELSNAFGVAQSEVINLGADFAQAGAEGVNNFKLTQLALEAMILGELDAETAGKSLIAVMAQYGLEINDGVTGTLDLKEAMALLNQVENNTAVNFADLLAVMERSAGSARTAGVTMRELAAMTAAIVPASGSAEKAGNGLRSMLSRILVPTKDAAEMVKILGINWQDFNNSTGTERLHMMAEAFEDVSAGQRAQASTLMASRYQVNRFDILMRDILNPMGMYQTSMRNTADATENMTTYQKELMTYIRSSPQSWKILSTQIQNSMARAIVPMMPALLGLAQQIAKLIESFTNLSPETQQFILVSAVLFAVLGPLMGYFGTLIGLVGRLGLGFVWLFGGLKGKPSAIARLGAAFKWVGVQAWDLTKILSGPLVGSLKALAVRAGLALKAFAVSMIGIAKRAALAAAGSLKVLAIQILTVARAAAFSAATGISRLITQLMFLAGVAWSRLVTTAIPALIGALKAMGTTAMVAWAKVAAPVLMVAAIAALIGIIVYMIWRFRDEIGDALGSVWDGVLKAWSAAPGAFVKFFQALWRIISTAIGKIAEQLSWLNPFARHSPSLVEQVSRGVDVIASKYASLSGIGAHFRGAINALKDWNAASAEAIRIMENQDRAETRATVVAHTPSAGPAFDRMVAGIDQLKIVLDSLGKEFAAQEFIVAGYADALAVAEAHLKRLEDAADITRSALAAIGAELDYAKEQLAEYAEAPLVGMGAMGDAIFDNEMAQKRLRLELLKMEQAGQSVEDLQAKLAALAGDLELLRGEREGLRLAGAGSDVLGPIDDQINAMQKMQDALSDTKNPIKDVQDQLEELERIGQILDLERSLKFDPLTRQIEKMVDTTKEITFDEAVAGVKRWQPEVERLTAAYEVQEEALRLQEVAITEATAARDLAKVAYDREKEALDLLGEAYDAVESQIRDMEGALNGFASAAKDAADKAKALKDELSDLEQAFADAGDYEIPGGDFEIPYEEGDIDALIDQMMKDMESSMGDMDFLKPIKDWIKRNFGGSWEEMKENWKVGFDILYQDWLAGWKKIADSLEDFWMGVFEWLGKGWSAVIGWFGEQWTTFKETWIGYWGGLGEDIANAWLDYKESFIGGWNAVVTWLSDEWTKYKEKWVAFYGGLGADVVDFWFNVKESVINGWNAVTKWLGGEWTAYKEKWVAYYGGLGEDIADAWLDYKEKFIGGWNAIVDWFTQRWADWKLGWSDYLGGLKRAFEGWWADLKVGWETFWDGLVDFLSDFPSKIGDRVRDGINGGIAAIDMLIGGINSISKKIGLDWEIRTIGQIPAPQRQTRGKQLPERAMGGTIPTAMVGAGFVTSGARAIVGEGSRIHPEYVVPTDPRYRGRAASLFGQLGNDLGFFAAGGILDRAQDAGRTIAGTVGDFGSTLKAGALNLLFAPVARSAQTLIDLIPERDQFIRRVATRIKDAALDWVKGKDREIPDPTTSPGPVGGRSIGGTGWQALVRYIQNAGVPHVVTSTYRPGGTTYHGKGRAADFSIGGHGNRGYGSGGLRNIFEAFSPVMGNLTELILAGAPYNIKHGRRVGGYAWGTPGSRGNHWNHVHAALAAGGIIPSNIPFSVFDRGGVLQPGLTMAYNGTGRPETVTTADGPANRELHFHGDLSFPNVRSGDDAEAFIRNLESLVT